MAHANAQHRERTSQAGPSAPPSHGAPGRGAGRTERPSSLSIALQQRKRALSSASPLTILGPQTLSSGRQRTSTGPMSSSHEIQRGVSQHSTSQASPSASASSSRFISSSSGFHLPQRAPPSSLVVPFAPKSPTSKSALSAAVAGEEAHIGPANSLPLLRRKAAAAALAHASRKGLRRGSMLGKEVAKDGEEQGSGEEDERMDDEYRATNSNDCSPSLDIDDQEEDMQIDTGDVTVAGVEMDSRPRQAHSPGRESTAVRRAVQRRANLLPRDRGVLRVAASLRDETRPAEGEIASEAKLQRRLGPESDSLAPTTPKLLARRSQSPFGASSAGPVDRSLEGDYFCFPEGAHFDLSDDSGSSGDDEATGHARNGPYLPMDSEESNEVGIAIPGVSETGQKERLWLEFRESTGTAMAGNNPRLSPGAERSMVRSRGPSMAPTGSASTTPLSGSLGAALDQAMDLEPYHHTGSSPSLWGRSAKRKIGDDRYDPYSSIALHKRRAVSPIALVSANNANGRGRSSTPTSTLSPGLSGISQMSPLSIQVPSHGTSSTATYLPTPTPLSIPSPTLSFSRGPGFSGSYPRSFPGLPPTRMSTSTNPSPASTRPSTPTNQHMPSMYAAGPSPSLLHSNSSKVAVGGAGGGGGGGGANGGSGPGYGSGALGLSLGGGSRRYKEEQEEKEEEEGMLGDVSAIKLGEL